jgi:hypothetical protein
MAHHLSMTVHPHVAPAEFILQAPVDTSTFSAARCSS